MAGEMERSRKTPRFVAISEQGICFKWNKNRDPADFYEEAWDYLFTLCEYGLIWDVGVVYKEDEKRKSRKTTFFRIEFDEDNLNNVAERKKFIRRIKKLRFYVFRHKCRTAAELCDYIAAFD